MIGERITSRANARVKYLRKLGTSRSFRYENRAFLCDGEKLLIEAHETEMKLGMVLVDELRLENLAQELPWLEEYRLFPAPGEVLASASALETPQSVLFDCAMPEPAQTCQAGMILLDRLQDAGNVGTIIRTADAFGLSGVVLDGCVDPFNPKTVRAAMGSIFRVPLLEAELMTFVPECRERGIMVCAAMLTPEAKSVFEVTLKHTVVIVGNEGSGVRPELAALCDHSIILPMRGETESLNASVAAAILIWEMTK